LELIEEKGHDRQGGQNDFKKALEDVENSEREREARNKSTRGKKREDSDNAEDNVLDLELLRTDPDKLYPLIYYALKRRLKDWEQAMEERPGRKLILFASDYLNRVFRGNQTDDSRKVGSSHSGAVSRISEASFQISSVKSMSFFTFTFTMQ
jgi:hypothetical protein